MPDYTFTMDDVSKVPAIALLTNHGLAYRNPIPTVADTALAPKATQSPKLKSVTSSPGAEWFLGQAQTSVPLRYSSKPKLNQSQSPLVCYVENFSSYGKNVTSLSEFHNLSTGESRNLFLFL